MKTYPKIETLFNRGPDFTVDTETFRRPEFAAIDRWIFTEKVDGTNIRIRFSRREGVHSSVLGVGIGMDIGGRTDNAQLPKPLEARLLERRVEWFPVVDDVLTANNIDSITLFGEGYGPKIQKGGGLYNDRQDFVLFDVLVNDKTWLDEDGISDVAMNFDLDRVATLFVGSYELAVEIVRGGPTLYDFYTSRLAANNNKAADFEIEGVVARPLVPLYNTRGDRVMWKLKGSDFRAGKR